MKYCTKCGSQAYDDAVICLNCGASFPSQNNAASTATYAQQSNNNKGLALVVKVFLIISCVSAGMTIFESLGAVILSLLGLNASGIFDPEIFEEMWILSLIFQAPSWFVIISFITSLISLGVNIAISVVVIKKLNSNKPVPMVLKILCLVLINLIAGICLLCMKDPVTNAPYSSY